MPRRRSTRGRSAAGKARPVDRADAKISKWNKASDVPLDEEDLFHASRDKVLLDGDNYLQDDDGDDDEVFALKGLEDDEDVDMDEDEEEEEEEGQEESVTTKKGKEKSKKKKKKTESSEEEGSESEEETWGRTKSAWYSSNAVQLESDDEEGNEKWETHDFGLGDALDVEGVLETDEFVESTPVVVEPLPQDQKLLLRHLEKTSPETLALARDWEDTVENLAKTQEKLAKLNSEDPDAISLGMSHVYYQTLLTYTTTLAFYLHLRSSEKYVQRPELLRTHPILRRLLTLKQSLTTLEDLDFDLSDSENDEDDESDDNTSMTWNEIMADGESVWDSSGEVAMDDDELRLLLEEASSKKRKPVQEESPKKKRKTTSTSGPTKAAPIFDLVEPEFAPSKASSSRTSSASVITDTYGEATSLQHADAADKSARKKTLRFHTSKIESASARRQGARNQAVGGDDDIPYRERKKEKDARLAKENAKLRGQGGENLDDTEPEPRPAKRRREGDDGSGDEEPADADGYYELVKKKSKEKKEHKKVEYEAMQEAARVLTPHRPKSVRNPRVKKRLKFDKAKKKLSSQKAVYKGGLADTGRYDGEKSGISKVVKSVRLG
ncbi:Sas10 C-terminal domain-containing protein [Lyophyllum atratum]|nr:Sas10 C-terminal domain-containing protein [Lyophyllum atratum]